MGGERLQNTKYLVSKCCLKQIPKVTSILVIDHLSESKTQLVNQRKQKVAFNPWTAHSPEIQSYKMWWGAASPILNGTPVVCIYTSYSRNHIKNVYIYIYINTELLGGNKGHQEETHHPTHRFRRLPLDLMTLLFEPKTQYVEKPNLHTYHFKCPTYILGTTLTYKWKAELDKHNRISRIEACVWKTPISIYEINPPFQKILDILRTSTWIRFTQYVIMTYISYKQSVDIM